MLRAFGGRIEPYLEQANTVGVSENVDPSN